MTTKSGSAEELLSQLGTEGTHSVSGANPQPVADPPPSPAAPPPEPGIHWKVLACWHEAGHTAAAWRYGHAPNVVSVRPGLSHGGVSIHENPDDFDPDDFDPDLPTQDQPHDVRAGVERRLIIRLAGGTAAELAALTLEPTGYTEPTPEASTAALLALPSRARELVESAEANAALETDDDLVQDLAQA